MLVVSISVGRLGGRNEQMQLLDPGRCQLITVGPRVRPRAAIPGPPNRWPRLLTGMIGAPLGLVPVDVLLDLPCPCAERSRISGQLDDLSGLRVEVVTVGGESGTELGVGHHGRVADAVGRIEAVATPTVCSPRQRPAAWTRALICRCG